VSNIGIMWPLLLADGTHVTVGEGNAHCCESRRAARGLKMVGACCGLQGQPPECLACVQRDCPTYETSEPSSTIVASVGYVPTLLPTWPWALTSGAAEEAIGRVQLELPEVVGAVE
jgi:hypothetical protein